MFACWIILLRVVVWCKLWWAILIGECCAVVFDCKRRAGVGCYVLRVCVLSYVVVRNCMG